MSLGATLNKNGKFYDEERILVAKIPSKFIQEVVHAQQRAINYTNYKGATVVVAAGNDYMNADGNGSTIVLPAVLNNVITVSAKAPYNILNNPFTNLDEPASYSNIGRSLVDIAAPGGDFDLYFADPSSSEYLNDMVLSTASEIWWWASGTSRASPHVVLNYW